MHNDNPFSINRVEQMKDLWRYYVPFKELPSDVNKPIVLEGGRGTGKSMFFRCNSWRERLAALQTSSNTPVADLIKLNQIGIYYKVDSSFVGAMTEEADDSNNWPGIFSTYLSVSLIRELLPLISICYNAQMVNDKNIAHLANAYYRVVHGTSGSCSIDDLQEDCDLVLQAIEDTINGISPTTSYRFSIIGSILKAFVDALRSIPALEKVSFRIYIDEYESLSEWQQKNVNTLIKTSSHDLIYNIGMRHNGMKTPATNAANEIIQATHDYYYFCFDNLLTEKTYAATLKDICKKRLELFFFEESICFKPEYANIEFYLSNYNSALELDRFNGKQFEFKKKLNYLIRELSENEKEADAYIEILSNTAPILNARLHTAILLRSKQFRPTVSELCNCFLAWKSKKTTKEAKKYREWLHNAQNGIIFLLAKESNLPKWYYGFDTYAALSSGIVRYFLELCEQAFNFAIMNGFDWTNPKQLTPDIQTRAAKYVSQYKVNEIMSYPIWGKKMRIFIQCFGEICRDLHHNENTTLGEPEINHFTTDSLQLPADVEENLRAAITWLVLQKLPQTKSKEDIKTSVLDYHLNKIYTPYFSISCNKKRKITLTPQMLTELFSGEIERAQKASQDFLRNYWENKSALLTSMQKVASFLPADASQLTWFDSNEGN